MGVLITPHRRAGRGAPRGSIAASLPNRTPALIVTRSPRESVMIAVEAAGVSTRAMAGIVRYSSGLVRVSMTPQIARQLDISFMAGVNPADTWTVPATVSVDAIEGTSTGISAHDRALTARRVADPRACPGDFTRPGHLLTHVVAAADHRSIDARILDLLVATGRRPVAVLAEPVSEEDPASMMGAAEAAHMATTMGWGYVVLPPVSKPH